MTQIDDSAKDRVIALFFRKLNSAEKYCTANDRKLFGLAYCLQIFTCHYERSSFEILADNQLLKYFFSKPGLSRRETRWIQILGNFGIFPINLKPEKYIL